MSTIPRCSKHEEFFAGYCQKCSKEAVTERIRQQYIAAQLAAQPNYEVRVGYYGGLMHTGMMKQSEDRTILQIGNLGSYPINGTVFHLDDAPKEYNVVESNTSKESIPEHSIQTVEVKSKKLKMWV